MKKITFVFIPFLFFSCLTITPYQPMDGLGKFQQGYSERQLKKNIWEVTFKANSRTPMETVQAYLLYRCAELTKERDYTNFLIVKNEKESKKFSYTAPSQKYGTYTRDYSGNIHYTEDDIGGQTYSGELPEATSKIYMFNAPETNMNKMDVYNADETIQLNEKYIQRP